MQFMFQRFFFILIVYLLLVLTNCTIQFQMLCLLPCGLVFMFSIYNLIVKLFVYFIIVGIISNLKTFTLLYWVLVQLCQEFYSRFLYCTKMSTFQPLRITFHIEVCCKDRLNKNEINLVYLDKLHDIQTEKIIMTKYEM